MLYNKSFSTFFFQKLCCLSPLQQVINLFLRQLSSSLSPNCSPLQDECIRRMNMNINYYFLITFLQFFWVLIRLGTVYNALGSSKAPFPHICLLLYSSESYFNSRRNILTVWINIFSFHWKQFWDQNLWKSIIYWGSFAIPNKHW